MASLFTPYLLGAVAGGIATGRLGIWWSPTSIYVGALTVGLCSYLAAAYLTGDARRLGAEAATRRFRWRALLAGGVVGVLALAGPLMLRADAPQLHAALLDRSLPLLTLSALCGSGSLALLTARRYSLIRVTAAVAVVAILLGWVLARYPAIVPPDHTAYSAAAAPAVLRALLVALSGGALLRAPSFAWLYTLFQRASHDH